jgi:hypothetical protein
MGFLVLSIAALPIESQARTSTACVPVYEQCVASEACGGLQAGTDARAACFASCNAEEAQCRGQPAVPASATEPESLAPARSAAPSTTPNKNK